MRRVIIASVLALVAGTALWQLVQRDPGYILIVVAGKTIEMRFAFAVLALLLVVVLWVWLRRLVRRGFGLLRGDWMFFTAARRARRAEQRTRRGLLHYFEGDWRGARRDLLKAARGLPDPLLQYLVAADSAYHMGQSKQALDLLVQAEQTAQRRPLAVAVNLARLQLAEGLYQESLATLHRARTQAPGNPAVLGLLRQAYTAVADWASLELLLPDLHHHKVLPAAEFAQLELQVYGLLLGKAADPTAPGGGLKALEETWHRMPKSLHQRPALVEAYARGLLLAGRHDQVENLLRQSLKHEWSETLVELYGLALAENRQAQLQTAQRWREQHPHNAVLYLTLARLSLRNQLWGQAREYLHLSIKLAPSAAAYAELARLLASLGEHKASLECYQQGLSFSARSLPNLPLPVITR